MNKHQMKETWIPITGWLGRFYISNHGRVKSIKGKYTKRYPHGYITRGCKDNFGYMVATLRSPGRIQRSRVHTLVAEHFLNRPSWADCVNHLDGNKANNVVSNLEWTTRGDNVRHAVKIGLHNLKGENHPHAKLTQNQVLQIRELSKNGCNHREIAEKFNICRRQAGDIVNRVNWGWLQDGL